ATAEPSGPPRSRRRRGLAVVGAFVLAVALGTAGGIWLAGGATTPASTADAAIAVDGPTESTVGQDATFTARTRGVDSWVGTTPTDAFVVDEPAVSVTARSSGSATVVLRARAPDGTDLEVVHELTVNE